MYNLYILLIEKLKCKEINQNEREEEMLNLKEDTCEEESDEYAEDGNCVEGEEEDINDEELLRYKELNDIGEALISDIRDKVTCYGFET